MSARFQSSSVRPPAVAGFFYPAEPGELRECVSDFLVRASENLPPSSSKAFIVPHAGYIYSGSTAAVVYAALQTRRAIRKVVLIGPSHRVFLRGAAVPSARAFLTPLGEVPVDAELKRALLAMPGVVESDAPHEPEHSLEVQLPFLQVALGEFTLAPIVVGDAPPAQVGAILDAIWGSEDTLVLASSDLSHYLSYGDAQRVDAQTSGAILAKQATLSHEQACGAVAVNGLLHTARERDLNVRALARCNSGDTAGDKTRVVGYGAYAFYDAD